MKHLNARIFKRSKITSSVAMWTLPHRVSYWRGCVGGWGLGRAALFEGGGLSPVGQLWVVGHPTHDERTAKVSLEHKLQGGMGKTIYFSYANGASDLKLYLPSKKYIYIPLCFGVFLPTWNVCQRKSQVTMVSTPLSNGKTGPRFIHCILLRELSSSVLVTPFVLWIERF